MAEPKELKPEVAAGEHARRLAWGVIGKMGIWPVLLLAVALYYVDKALLGGKGLMGFVFWIIGALCVVWAGWMYWKLTRTEAARGAEE